ncbi:hypothetical protein B0H19DRAFT_1294531, partial [Mycena capillaripes]
DVGFSFWTFVSALHILCLVVLGITLRPYVLSMTLIADWLGLGILAMTGPAVLDTAHRGPFCWITCFVVFLRMRGNVMITGKQVMFSKTSSNEGLGQQVESRTMSVARKMFLLGLQPVPVFDGSTDGMGGFLPGRLGPRARGKTGRVGLAHGWRCRDLPICDLRSNSDPSSPQPFAGRISGGLRQFRILRRSNPPAPVKNGRYGRDGWDPPVARLSSSPLTAGYPVNSRYPQATLIAELLQVAYTVVILPIAAARFSSISETVFLLSGIVNVILLTTTRRILPAGSIKLPRFRVNKRAVSRPQIVTEYALESGSYSSHHRVSGTYTLKAYSSVDSTEGGPARILAPPASKEVIPNS